MVGARGEHYEGIAPHRSPADCHQAQFAFGVRVLREQSLSMGENVFDFLPRDPVFDAFVAIACVHSKPENAVRTIGSIV